MTVTASDGTANEVTIPVYVVYPTISKPNSPATFDYYLFAGVQNFPVSEFNFNSKPYDPVTVSLVSVTNQNSVITPADNLIQWY